MRYDFVVDMDGICCDFVPAICAVHNNATGDKLKPSDVTDWDLRKFGVADELWKKPGFFYSLDPILGAKEVLWKWRKEYNFCIATDDMGIDYVQREKQAWLDKHLPFIKSRYFGRDKSWIPGRIIIDDAPHHLNEFPNLKIKMNYPYNHDIYADFHVENWQQIDAIFKQGAIK